MSRRSIRCARAVSVGAVAAVAGILGAPAPASAADTFSGTCTGQEGWASFPEHPLGVVPVDMLMRARLSGGECSGTLNGREVEAQPATATARLRGLQSCSAGATAGRFTFELRGRRFTGDMTYRRVGSRVTALWQGDAGGSAVVVVHAAVSLVAEDHPAATLPVVGPHIAGPVTTDDVLRRCAGEGISRIPIVVDRIIAAPYLSG